MASHRINLRGPWDYTWQTSFADAAEPLSKNGTVTMPQEWQAVFGEISGTAQFLRKFHRPTNLDPHERVFIVFTEVRGTGSARLNQLQLGTYAAEGNSVEFEITSGLEPFNELAVEISFQTNRIERQAGGLFGIVALEIRSE